MSRREPLVLSVDDDPCIGRVLELKLGAAGYRTVRALTAEDGLAKIRQLRPDVVVTDVRLPGISGLELCRICEPLQQQRPFLIIVLTSQMEQDSLEWIESNPFRRYISKPFSPRALAGMIRKYLEHLPLPVEVDAQPPTASGNNS